MRITVLQGLGGLSPLVSKIDILATWTIVNINEEDFEYHDEFTASA